MTAFFGAIFLFVARVAGAQDVVRAVSVDPPANQAHPARMEVVHIPTHGVKINGVLYLAAGAELHKTVLLFHGLPGNEQNPDLAQAIRRDGWNVLTLHYRGSWGSPGVFSFTHEFEDTQAALDFIRTPVIAKKYGIDIHRVVIGGHSMGGLAVALLGSRNKGLSGVFMISGFDASDMVAKPTPKERKAYVAEMADNMESLAGTSPSKMADELEANSARWTFVACAKGLAHQPLLVITSDDGSLVPNKPLIAAITKLGGHLDQEHIPTDHSYSDHRIALETAVLKWLDNLIPATTH